MGLTKKSLKKGSPKGSPLKRGNPTKDFFSSSSNSYEGEDGEKGQPPLPLVPP
jgi:hypothetical protein